MVGGKNKTYIGHVKEVQGRAAKIRLKSRFEGAAIRSIHTVGKDPSTTSERLLESIILGCLQRTINFVDLPFVAPIWFPVETPCPRRQRFKTQIPSHPFLESLNHSQKEAVEAIVSDEPTDNLVLVHGPPGTGKTTVIARATLWKVALAGSNTMWLVAHSNIAVKNIAEKLATSNFLEFKLLVSCEFHFDWYVYFF
jgi:AAA domain